MRKAAAKMNDGTSHATVMRWETSKKKPDAEKVVSFCRAYGENPVVGFVNAGYITDEEARDYSISALSDDDLIAALEAEIKKRTQRRRKGPGQAAPPRPEA